jgi:carboxylate-amine ligase
MATLAHPPSPAALLPAAHEPQQRASVHDHNFGREPAFALGVEEELLVVDRERHQLAMLAERALSAIGADATREIFSTMIEFATPICRSATEAVTALARLRTSLGATGVTACGCGVHPMADFGDVRISSAERYERVADTLQGILRTPTAALQVHVGMPDAETAIRVFNGMRPYVPLLQALAANSPYWHAHDSGLASTRAAILRSYPRAELPRAFADYADFARTADELTSVAEVDDYTHFWWDIRPHPRIGTVEVRTMDAQSSLDTTAGLVALVHGLARHAAEAPPAMGPSPEALRECMFRASRYGLDATLIDPGGVKRPARELAYAAVTLARPHAAELGCDDALDEVVRVARDGNGAERQRRAGDPRAALRWLVDDTADSTRQWAQA